jgi:hypothetical protein
VAVPTAVLQLPVPDSLVSRAAVASQTFPFHPSAVLDGSLG